MNFGIRLAHTGDLPSLELLIAESVRGLSAGFYTEQLAESALRYVFGVDTQLIEDESYYVVEFEARLVACGGWSRRNTLYGGDRHKAGADPLLDPLTDAARIRAFFVHPDFARMGIGRTLIQTCEKAARDWGFRRCQLGATLPGVPLYLAMGYRRLEDKEEVLPDGARFKLVVMDKNLTCF